MASPPPGGGGPVLDEKVKLPPSEIHDVHLDPSLSGNATLDTKTATLKIVDEMAQPQVNQAAVQANGDVAAVVNGHSRDESQSNGVNAPDEPHQSTDQSPASPVPQDPPEQPQQQRQEEEVQQQEQQEEDAPAILSTTAGTTAMLDTSISKPEPSPTGQGEQAATPPASGNAEPTSNGLAPAPEKPEESEKSPGVEADEVKLSPTSIAAPDLPANTQTGLSAPVTPSTEKPADSAPAAEEPQIDQEMTDAPPMSPSKISRGREEDESEEPAAKRTKTDEGSQSDAQFKVPEAPASASALDSQSTTPQITKMQSKFLIRTLQSLKRSHDARFYRTPVDPVVMNIPNYPVIVKEPMDLRTLDDKLKAGKYQFVDQVREDMKLMVHNARTFNGPDHVVTHEGDSLLASFERHLQKLPGPDEVELTAAQKKAKKVSTPGIKSQPLRESRVAATRKPSSNSATSPTTFALGPEGLPLIRRDSSAVDGRPKRSIHPPKNRDFPLSTKPKKKKFQWELKFCQEVLDELRKPKYYSFAAAFYLPVDPVALNIPTYHSIIKKPMDLQTIQTKLDAGSYENAREFELDTRQIFKNCFKFNIAGDPTHTSGKRLEELFQHKWSQKNRWLETHEPTSGHQSAGSDESDEEAESEEEQEEEKLTALEKQIAEMSKRVQEITQKNKKKKKTPPTTSKKEGTKQKGGKKETKKAPGKKGKKAGPKAKPEKQRWVTYHEKQLISNGIGSLPDKRMNEALDIIRKNVPSLKDTNETEIELDMDELPNEVLLLLLDFVKKHAPAALEFDDPAPEPVPTMAPSRPKKNKPMSKHEQEATINMLEGSLKHFQGGAGHISDPAAAAESSDDEEDSEESEEE